MKNVGGTVKQRSIALMGWVGVLCVTDFQITTILNTFAVPLLLVGSFCNRTRRHLILGTQRSSKLVRSLSVSVLF